MSRGIYSALGHWPEAELARVVETLREIGRAVARDDDDHELAVALPSTARAALLATVREIRMFEARVGQATGIDAEIVTTPTGPAIELRNRGHVGFRSCRVVLDGAGTRWAPSSDTPAHPSFPKKAAPVAVGASARRYGISGTDDRI